MPSIAVLPDPPKPLPQVPGPKLAPFTPTAYVDIDFVEELGNPEEHLDGHVWKVKINGASTCYALKMFRFRYSEDLRETVGRTLTRPLASPRLYIDYLDPFSCECRAYGRLQEENRQDLAVRAHGYLLLTPQQEAEVEQRSGGFYFPPVDDKATSLDGGTNSWGRWEEHRNVPVRVIVKELATECEPFTPAQLQGLWRDLEDLHELGILVRDVSIGNYMGGKLIDFSRSWTVPHPCFESIDPYWMCEERQADPLALDGAILDWAFEARWEQEHVDMIPQELRECVSGEGHDDPYGTDPRHYDWRKWEEDFETVDAFFEHGLYGAPEPEGEQSQE